MSPHSFTLGVKVSASGFGGESTLLGFLVGGTKYLTHTIQRRKGLFWLMVLKVAVFVGLVPRQKWPGGKA